jgi:prevent-host-death family protein
LSSVSRKGEEVLVTRHGKPVARLVAPEASSDASALAEWTADLRAFRRGVDRAAQGPAARSPN